MTLTQDDVIHQIAIKEDIDVATVRNVLKTAEDIIFDYLSSTTPSIDVVIKILNGINIKREYVEPKIKNGHFKNQKSKEHVKIKSNITRYFSDRVNDELFNKN